MNEEDEDDWEDLPTPIREEDRNAVWNRPCSTWADRQRMGLGYDTAPKEWFQPRFDVICRRTKWLDLIGCRACGELWYVAVDTRDDDYYFIRLTDDEVNAILFADEWPPLFDAFDRFWERDLMRRTDLKGLPEQFFPPPAPPRPPMRRKPAAV